MQRFTLSKVFVLDSRWLLAVLLFASDGIVAQNYIPTALTTLEGNGVRALLGTGGDLWYDTENYRGYDVWYAGDSLTGRRTNTMHAGGLWFAARDTSGTYKAVAQQYGRIAGGFDFEPGPLHPGGEHFGTPEEWDRFFKVRRASVNTFRELWASGALTVDNIPPEVKGWPAVGNPYFTASEGLELPNNPSGGLAPFWDENRDGWYDPLDGDYPAFCGEEAIWWVMNDNRVHRNSQVSDPLLLEIQVMAYAVPSTNDVLHRTTFYEYKIINRSEEPLLDIRTGL